MAVLQKLLLILATDFVVVGPVDEFAIDMAQAAAAENLPLDLDGDFADLGAQPGPPLADQSINLLLLVCLEELGHGLVRLRGAGTALDSRIDRAIGEGDAQGVDVLLSCPMSTSKGDEIIDSLLTLVCLLRVPKDFGQTDSGRLERRQLLWALSFIQLDEALPGLSIVGFQPCGRIVRGLCLIQPVGLIQREGQQNETTASSVIEVEE